MAPWMVPGFLGYSVLFACEPRDPCLSRFFSRRFAAVACFRRCRSVAIGNLFVRIMECPRKGRAASPGSLNAPLLETALVDLQATYGGAREREPRVPAAPRPSDQQPIEQESLLIQDHHIGKTRIDIRCVTMRAEGPTL